MWMIHCICWCQKGNLSTWRLFTNWWECLLLYDGKYLRGYLLSFTLWGCPSISACIGQAAASVQCCLVTSNGQFSFLFFSDCRQTDRNIDSLVGSPIHALKSGTSWDRTTTTRALRVEFVTGSTIGQTGRPSRGGWAVTGSAPRSTRMAQLAGWMKRATSLAGWRDTGIGWGARKGTRSAATSVKGSLFAFSCRCGWGGFLLQSRSVCLPRDTAVRSDHSRFNITPNTCNCPVWHQLEWGGGKFCGPTINKPRNLVSAFQYALVYFF